MRNVPSRSLRALPVVALLTLSLACPDRSIAAFSRGGEPEGSPPPPSVRVLSPEPEPAAGPPAPASPAAGPAVAAPAPGPAPAPAPAPALAPRPSKMRAGGSMMAAGFSVFGVLYLVTAISGALVIDATDWPHNDDLDPYDKDRRRSMGRRLTIPIAGPFMAMGYSESAMGGFGLAFDGAVQGIMFTMAIAGIGLYAAGRREMRLAYGRSEGGTSLLTYRLRF